MTEPGVLDELARLLDADDATTVNTSMRLSANLRDAAALAVDRLEVAPSTTSLVEAALRSALETRLMQAALDAHYADHPMTRPSLAEVAVALARLEGSSLADHPDVIAEAAEQIVARHADADAHDVLVWAEARLAPGSSVA